LLGLTSPGLPRGNRRATAKFPRVFFGPEIRLGMAGNRFTAQTNEPPLIQMRWHKQATQNEINHSAQLSRCNPAVIWPSSDGSIGFCPVRILYRLISLFPYKIPPFACSSPKKMRLSSRAGKTALLKKCGSIFYRMSQCRQKHRPRPIQRQKNASQLLSNHLINYD
jgi:hypothetical protein